jgi:hypothetical protein
VYILQAPPPSPDIPPPNRPDRHHPIPRNEHLVFEICGVSQVIGSSPICDGAWHTAAVVLRPSEPRGEEGEPNAGGGSLVQLYVDGELDKEGVVPHLLDDISHILRVGKGWGGMRPAGAASFPPEGSLRGEISTCIWRPYALDEKGVTKCLLELEEESWFDEPWVELTTTQQAQLSHWRDRMQKQEARHHGDVTSFKAKTAHEDMLTFLEKLDLQQYMGLFVREELTLTNLPHLSKLEFKEMGLPLGPATTIFEFFMRQHITSLEAQL